jgi:hypothetical protein
VQAEDYRATQGRGIDQWKIAGLVQENNIKAIRVRQYSHLSISSTLAEPIDQHDLFCILVSSGPGCHGNAGTRDRPKTKLQQHESTNHRHRYGVLFFCMRTKLNQLQPVI